MNARDRPDLFDPEYDRREVEAAVRAAEDLGRRVARERNRRLTNLLLGVMSKAQRKQLGHARGLLPPRSAL